jgi:hypothetical protein
MEATPKPPTASSGESLRQPFPYRRSSQAGHYWQPEPQRRRSSSTMLSVSPDRLWAAAMIAVAASWAWINENPRRRR